MHGPDLALTDPQVEELAATLLRLRRDELGALELAADAATKHHHAVADHCADVVPGSEPHDALAARASEARARFYEALNRLEVARAAYDKHLSKLEDAIVDAADADRYVEAFSFFFEDDGEAQ